MPRFRTQRFEYRGPVLVLDTGLERAVLAQRRHEVTKRPALNDRERIQLHVTVDKHLQQSAWRRAAGYQVLSGVHGPCATSQAGIPAKPVGMLYVAQLPEFAANRRKCRARGDFEYHRVLRNRHRRVEEASDRYRQRSARKHDERQTTSYKKCQAVQLALELSRLPERPGWRWCHRIRMNWI